MRTRIRLLLAICILICPLKLSGQAERLVIPGELKQQTIVTEPITLRRGFVKAGIQYSHSFIDKMFFEDKRKSGLGSTISGQSSSYKLHVMYGLTNRLELIASIPYFNQSLYQTVEYQWENDIEISRWSQKGNGIGDAELGFRYVVLTENETRPSLFVGITTTFPTGEKNPTNIKDERNFDVPVGSGEYAFTLEMKARKVIYPYSFSIYGFYNLKTGGAKIMEPYEESIPFKDGNYLGLTASGYMHLNDWIVLANDFQYGKRGDDEIDGEIVDSNNWYIHTTPYLYFQIFRALP